MCSVRLEEGSDARESLHNIAQAYFNFSREHKNYFDVINYFLSAADVVFAPEIKQQIDQHGIRILKVVEHALQDGVEQGQFRMIDVRRHALLFWVILHGLVPFRKMKDTLLADDSHSAFYRFAVDNFIGGLSQGMPFERVPEVHPSAGREEKSKGMDVIDRSVTVIIDAEKCVGCEACLQVCPSETLTMVDGKAVVTGQESLGCGHCAAVCPTEAIRVKALDNAVLDFETFSHAPHWLPPGEFPLDELVRLMRSRRSCRNFSIKPFRATCWRIWSR